MDPMRIALRIFSLLAVLTAAAAARAAPEVPRIDVRIVDDKLSVHATAVPLQELLQQFQDAGVRVQIDQRINPQVTANFEDRDMYRGLQSLLTDCDYAIVWSTIKGPAGQLKRISQIDVFKPGERKLATPLPGRNTLKPVRESLKAIPVLCVRNEVLVRLRPGTGMAALRDMLVRVHGTVVDSIPALGIYRIRLTPDTPLADALNLLAGSPDVERAEPNLLYRLTAPKATALAASHAAQRAGAMASGTAVAVLDTGWNPAAGPGRMIAASLDALDPERPISDSQGHGTQMSLLASGTVSPVGVDTSDATVVPVVAVRAFDEAGYASSFGLMNSMMFALDEGARVINLSWGSEVDSRFVADAVDYAQRQGAVVVAAAGNTPSGQPFYPAAYPGVVAVSALLPSGDPWPSSNYGSFVTLAAPGVADLPVGYNGPAGGYAGTSIASAYTANTIARYLAQHPAADGRQAVAALTNAILRVSASPGNDPHLGVGRLDSQAVATYLK